MSDDKNTASQPADEPKKPAKAEEAKPVDDLFADFSEIDGLVEETGLSAGTSQITLRSGGEVNTFPFWSESRSEFVPAGLSFDSASLLTLRFYSQIIGGQASLALPKNEQQRQFILEGSVGLRGDTLGLIDPATNEIIVPPVLKSPKTQIWRNRMHIISFQQMSANPEVAELLQTVLGRAKYVEQPNDPQRVSTGAREYIWRMNPQGESPTERLENGIEVTRMVVSVDNRKVEGTGEWMGFRDFLTATMANIARAVKANAANLRQPNAYLGELTGTQSDGDSSLYAARPGLPEMSIVDTQGRDHDLVLVLRKNGPSAGVSQG